MVVVFKQFQSAHTIVCYSLAVNLFLSKIGCSLSWNMDFSSGPLSSFFTETYSASMDCYNDTYHSTSDLDSTMLLSGVSPLGPTVALGFEVGGMVDPTLLDWHQYSENYEATPMEYY